MLRTVFQGLTLPTISRKFGHNFTE